MIIDDFTIDGTTVIPNPEEEATEELNKLQIEDTVYSVGSGGGGGGRTIELIVGDMTASYILATPTYALPTSKTALPTGKHWSDYDEIIIVSIPQQTPSSIEPQRYFYTSIPTWSLSHNIENYGVQVTTNTNTNQGTRVAIFPDDYYQNLWYNYAAPIAILGVKYN